MMRLWSTALVLGFLAGPASAQLLGGGGVGGLGGLGQLPSGVTGGLLAAGFTIVRDEVIDEAGPHVVVLRPPPHLSLKRAMAALHAAAPGAAFDYNSVFEPAGGPLRPDSKPPVQDRRSEGANGVT